MKSISSSDGSLAVIAPTAFPLIAISFAAGTRIVPRLSGDYERDFKSAHGRYILTMESGVRLWLGLTLSMTHNIQLNRRM